MNGEKLGRKEGKEPQGCEKAADASFPRRAEGWLDGWIKDQSQVHIFCHDRSL